MVLIKNIVWKDKNGNCKCESCGKTVSEKKLKWDKDLGYCKSCYEDIQQYNMINYCPEQKSE
ncbi:MAG: hypothetical protein E7508_10660 [Ruminococcus sp.]|nr:hypothetical protein [Ruminococcus sp.]